MVGVLKWHFFRLEGSSRSFSPSCSVLQPVLSSGFKATLPPLSDSIITELAHAAPLPPGRQPGPPPLSSAIYPPVGTWSFQAAQSPGKARIGVGPPAFLQRPPDTGWPPAPPDDPVLPLHTCLPVFPLKGSVPGCLQGRLLPFPWVSAPMSPTRRVLAIPPGLSCSPQPRLLSHNPGRL